MWIVDEITLVDFYDQHLRIVRAKGFKILILALIRDADAPSFYADLGRYWTSLDDVTGKHMVFAVAGSKAAEAIGQGNMVSLADQDGRGYSPQIAVAEDRTTLRQTPDWIRDRIAETRSVRTLHDVRERFHRPQITKRELGEVTDGNTSQVSKLRAHLSIPEASVPCLHVTLLTPQETVAKVLRLDSLGDFSIYSVCKYLNEELDKIFTEWDAPADPDAWPPIALLNKEIALLNERAETLAETQRAKARAQERARTVGAKVGRLFEEARAARTLANSEIFDVVLSRSARGDRNIADKKPLFLAVQKALGSGKISKYEAEILFSLLGHAFNDHVLRHCATSKAARGVADEAAETQKLRELQDARKSKERERRREVFRLVELQAVAIERAKAKLDKLDREWQAASREPRWKYFISYAAPDRELAIRVFEAIEKLGRTFLDHYCLLPTQDWTKRIPAFQSNSETTVALITARTKDAHYQNSEIRRAIDLYRSGRHELVPVYFDSKPDIPFGLEQIHGIVPASDGTDPVSLLVRHLSGRERSS